MTMEEVQAEFAGIVGPLLRKRLEQSATAASGGRVKGPKDPQDSAKTDITENSTGENRAEAAEEEPSQFGT